MRTPWAVIFGGMNHSPQLLTLAELATYLRLPRLWLRDEAIAGRIPSLRIGRRLRFDASAVEAALLRRASNREESQPCNTTNGNEK